MFNRRQALEGQSASAVIYTFTALRLHGLVPRNASVRAASRAALATSTFALQYSPNCAMAKINAMRKGKTSTNSIATTPWSSRLR